MSNFTFTQPELSKILQEITLFSELSVDEINQLMSNFTPIILSAGDVLIEENSVGNSMYIVVDGTLDISRERVGVINTIAKGDIVGELALLTEQARIATVTATTDTQLLECSRRGLENTLNTFPNLVSKFSEVVLPRIRSVYLMDVLTSLIGQITSDELEAFQNRTEWVHLKRGEILFSAGDHQREMYIVVTGRLRVLSPDDNQITIGEVGAGETVGELSLLSDEPHTATVIAIRDCYVVRVDEGDYLWLAESHPQISADIAGIIIKRQQEFIYQAKTRREQSITFAVVPLQSDIDLARLTSALRDHIQPFGTIETLDSNDFDALYGYEGASSLPQDHPIHIMVTSWMNQLERDNRYIIYLADPTLSQWTQRCIEQADRILFVGSSTASHALHPVEQAIQAQYPQVRTELILLHPESTTMPSGTANWLDVRSVHTHHHIRLNDASHIRRTARRLTGHATGIVFGGGGARGMAHLGVIRGFEDEDIIIDMIGGTSIGALIGAAYALTGAYKDMYDLAEKISNSKSIFDYTFPMVAIMKSKKVSRLLQTTYGDVSIEDLWIPFFCIASNLSKAEMIVSTRGKLHKALRASMSIPGVFSPVIRDGDIIIDGGVMNNFPIDIMQQWVEGGTVIGLTSQSERPTSSRRKFEIEDDISGWKILFNRLNPFSKNIKVPLLPITFLKTLEINTLEKQRTYRHAADLILNTDVHEFGLLAFDDYEKITEKGYSHALPLIQEWLKTQPNYVKVDVLDRKRADYGTDIRPSIDER